MMRKTAPALLLAGILLTPHHEARAAAATVTPPLSTVDGLRRGTRLLTLDLQGLGEMRPATSGPARIQNAIDPKQAQKAMLVARNLVALRAEAACTRSASSAPRAGTV